MALKVTKAKLNTEFRYTPLSEAGEDKPFTVYFTAISLDKLAALQDAALKVDSSGAYSVSVNTLNYEVLKTALTGWENVESDNGPVAFKRTNEGTTEGSLALIPTEMRNEIATVIVEVSRDLPNAEEYLKTLTDLAADAAEEVAEERETEKAEEAEASKPAKRTTK